MSWRLRAACRTTGVAAAAKAARLFFRSQGQSLDEAKALCRTCPVRRDCLAYAMRVEAAAGEGQRHGVWAGLGPAQRRRLDRCTTGRCEHVTGKQCLTVEGVLADGR